MGLTATLSAPLFSGSLTSSTEVGVKFPVGLDGRGYMIDDRREGEWRHTSVPLLRPQADQSSAPGVQSINPEDLWRSSVTSWHRGAGQTWRNKDSGELGEVSNPYRFNASLGVDVWDEGEISLLQNTEQKLASTATNLGLAVAGGFLYVADDQTLKRTPDLSAFTSITGGPAAAITSTASTGADVYVAYGASDVAYVSDTAGTTMTALTGSAALNADILGFAKGRLMAAVDNVVWNITSTSVAASVYSHPDAGWTWVGFAEGIADIYMAGYSGDKSIIYRTAVQPDGTALAIPVQAGELPDGEIVTGIYGYLGEFIVIGTTVGVRFATVDASGDLVIGDSIPIPSAQAFEGQGRFVWFGWTNYDASNTGLGRLDPSAVDYRGQPAYASDIMAAAQGAVVAAATYNDNTVFSVSGAGVYAETADLVASGSIDMGLEDYGLVEDKVAESLVARATGAGTVTGYLRVRAGTFEVLSVNSTTQTEFDINSVRGSAFESRLVLSRDATDLTAGPTVDQVILRSYPAVATTRLIFVPLRLWETDTDLNGAEFARNVGEELDILWGVRDARELVQWQEGTRSYSVIVEDIEWRPDVPEFSYDAFQGTCFLRMKKV